LPLRRFTNATLSGISCTTGVLFIMVLLLIVNRVRPFVGLLSDRVSELLQVMLLYNILIFLLTALMVFANMPPMNRYSILRFGSTFEFVEMKLRRDGYACEFSCMGGDHRIPPGVWKKGESGWVQRKAIKDWCQENGVKDYKIVRNTGYVKDLHGVVYELWIHTKEQMQRVIQKWALKGRTITEDDFSCLKGIVRGDEYLVVSEMEKCGFRKTENNTWTRTDG